MSQEEKLERFKQAIFSDADAQIDQIKAETGGYQAQALEQAQNHELENAFESMQKAIKKIRQDFKQKLTVEKFNESREILDHRHNIENKIFDAISQRLLAFTKSANYPKHLQGLLSIYAENKLFQGADIYIKPDDAQYSDIIKSVFKNDCDIIIDANIKYGGIKLEQRRSGVFADETFDNRLNAARKHFIEHHSAELNLH